MGRHSERLAQGVVQPRAGHRDGLALNFICHACIIFEQLVHVGDIALRLAERFADVQGFEPRQFLEMVPQLGPQEPEEPTALARIEIPPFRGFEAAPRGFDRGTHVVLRPGGDPRNRSVRRGVEDLGLSPRGGGDPLPSDVVAVVFDVHRESAPTIGVRPISVWILLAFTGALLFSAGRLRTGETRCRTSRA